MSVRALPIALLLALLLIGSAVPATAGTRDDPELTDPCGGDPATVRVDGEGIAVTTGDAVGSPWADVCAAWLDVSGGVVTATVELLAPVEDRTTGAFYLISWDAGGCTHRVYSDDEDVVAGLPGDDGLATTLHVDCDGTNTVLDVPDEAVTTAGGLLSVAIDLTDEVFADLAGRHAPGALLTDLSVTTASPVVGAATPLGLTPRAYVVADEVTGGRAYEVPGD